MLPKVVTLANSSHHLIFSHQMPRSRDKENSENVHFRHVTKGKIEITQQWQVHNGAIITCSSAEPCVFTSCAAKCVLFSCSMGRRSHRSPSRAPLCRLAPRSLSQAFRAHGGADGLIGSRPCGAPSGLSPRRKNGARFSWNFLI